MVLIIKHGATKKEIAKIMKQLSALPPTKYLDAKRFCGTVKFKLDAMELQKQWRNAWK